MVTVSHLRYCIYISASPEKLTRFESVRGILFIYKPKKGRGFLRVWTGYCASFSEVSIKFDSEGPNIQKYSKIIKNAALNIKVY